MLQKNRKRGLVSEGAYVRSANRFDMNIKLKFILSF